MKGYTYSTSNQINVDLSKDFIAKIIKQNKIINGFIVINNCFAINKKHFVSIYWTNETKYGGQVHILTTNNTFNIKCDELDSTFKLYGFLLNQLEK